MASRLIWSPAARLDLREIFECIEADNPLAARKFIRHLMQAVERLEEFPESGRIVPEFGVDVIREIIIPPCRIVYRLGDGNTTIEIVRIWHSARGIPDIQ